jgi:hypothetical protein
LQPYRGASQAMRAAKGEWVDGAPVWQHREDSLTPRCRDGFRQREGLPE